MTEYIVRRLILAVFVCLSVAIAVFLVMRLLPGDPLLIYMAREDMAEIGFDYNAIYVDPLDKKTIETIMTADILAGRDRFCRSLLNAVRSGKIGSSAQVDRL